MRGRPPWRFWVRGALLAAIGGHWLGNVICDRGEYLGAGLDYTWRASMPLIIQTILVAMVIAAVELVPDRPTARLPRLSTGAILRWLVISQVGLFLAFEGTERLFQADEVAAGGLFGSGFGLELVFAIVGSLVLLALGSAALRAIRSIRRRPPTAFVATRVVVPVRRIAVARVVAGPLGRRAPPLPV